MKYIVSLNGNRYEVDVTEETQSTAVSAATAPSPSSPVISGKGEAVAAPMPGTVLDIKVSEGARVKAGDVVMILEAMKMENEMLAPEDGVVKQITVTKGSAVNTGDTMYILG